MIALQVQTIEQIIKDTFANLSSGQKKVAEYILNNLNKAAFSTAEQIGREINISQTTVIRLSYALGFSGFSEMQASIQKQVLSKQEISAQQQTPIEDATSFSNILDLEIAMLQEFKNKLNEDQVWTAVNWLIEADQVLVIGHRTSSAPALWFSIGLNDIRDNVHLSSSSTDTINKFLSINEKSVVFFISYPRYTKYAIQLAQCAKEQGARIISATDQVLSKASRLADLAFIAKTNVVSGTNPMVSLICLMNMILFGMNKKMSGEIQTRRIKLEQYYSSFNVFDE